METKIGALTRINKEVNLVRRAGLFAKYIILNPKTWRELPIEKGAHPTTIMGVPVKIANWHIDIMVVPVL